MKTPHVHATIIKAWADGAQIEVRVGGGGPCNNVMFVFDGETGALKDCQVLAHD